MLFDENFINQSLTLKSFLINIAIEKQNAIKICEMNGNGLDSIMSYAFENVDHLMLKLSYNISLHGGSILDIFLVNFIIEILLKNFFFLEMGSTASGKYH